MKSRLSALFAGLAFLLLLSFVGIRYIPFWTIDRVCWETELPETAEMERVRLRIVGRNRWSIKKGEVIDRLEGLPYVESASMSTKGNAIHIKLEKKEGVIISGTSIHLFTDGKETEKLPPGDASSLRGTYLTLLVEPGRASYISSWGLGPEFERVVALMLELSAGLCYNANLVSYGSYESSQGPGFGTLKLVSERLRSELSIHEDMDGKYLASLLLSLDEEKSERGLGMRRFEIKDNTLKERKKGD